MGTQFRRDLSSERLSESEVIGTSEADSDNREKYSCPNFGIRQIIILGRSRQDLRIFHRFFSSFSVTFRFGDLHRSSPYDPSRKGFPERTC